MTCFYAFYKLTESPPTWFDEGTFIQVAHSIAYHGIQGIQTAPGIFASTGHISGGFPFLWPVALSLKVFGNSLFAARLPMALFIVVCAGAAYLFIYSLCGPLEALLALLLIATFPILYGNGKNVLGEVPGMFYTISALYFLWQLEVHAYKGARWYVFAGLCVGLAAATKPIFLLLPAALLLVWIVQAWRRPSLWRAVWPGVLAVIVILLLWAYLQFGSTDTLSSIFSHYTNPYAETSLVHIVLQNVLRFFTELTPMYCATLMLLWTVAVGIRVYYKKELSLSEQAAFAFSLLILAAYVRTAGWYRYFFEAMVLALIFAPVSLHIISAQVAKWRPTVSIVKLWTVPLLLLGAAQLYSLNYSSWVSEHNNSIKTAQMEAYFPLFPQHKSVLIYNTPEVVPFLTTDDYYQYFDTGPVGMFAYGQSNSALVEKGAFDFVITTSGYYQEYPQLFAQYEQTDSVADYTVLAHKPLP